jgi:hypothetical protein
MARGPFIGHGISWGEVLGVKIKSKMETYEN